jgi:hypothetical protein
MLEVEEVGGKMQRTVRRRIAMSEVVGPSTAVGLVPFTELQREVAMG